ncbi:hypothetical protein DF039_10170 [Burkholderia cenocepacia]|nr:hypothetical protein DF039_10170 [Burkholderia cenocepacia]RQV66868.1 hypothetical protein DF024_07430 [Burkholderia cenocepacia]
MPQDTASNACPSAAGPHTARCPSPPPEIRRPNTPCQATAQPPTKSTTAQFVNKRKVFVRESPAPHSVVFC